jgi:transposase
MTEHTPMSSVSRLEVIATGSRRRWTLAEKRRIVAESYRAPRIVSATARRHGLTPSQLFTWRRLDSQGRLTADEDEPRFVPAIVADGLPAPPLTLGPVGLPAVPEAATASSGAVARGVMEIVLVGGGRVIVDKDVNGAALARVIAVLARS